MKSTVGNVLPKREKVLKKKAWKFGESKEKSIQLLGDINSPYGSE